MPDTNGLLVRIDERTKNIVDTLDDMREDQQKDRAQIKKNTEAIIRHDEKLSVINRLGGAIGLTSLGAIGTSVWSKFF